MTRWTPRSARRGRRSGRSGVARTLKPSESESPADGAAWYRRSVWRWLAADPRDVVDLAGARELGDPARGSDLPEELRRWRRIVARRRLAVLIRRHAAVALGLAL